MPQKVAIRSDDWSTFNEIATVEDWNPVPGSSQVWLRSEDGTRIAVARGEVEPVTDERS
jgi:hypothetical protein